jgi:tetratricopeptide (TPR) repeat protein
MSRPKSRPVGEAKQHWLRLLREPPRELPDATWARIEHTLTELMAADRARHQRPSSPPHRPAGQEPTADELDRMLDVIDAYDSFVRTEACKLLRPDGLLDAREVDVLCVETWITIFRTHPPDQVRQPSLARIIEVMRVRYEAFARQEMRALNKSMAGPFVTAPTASNGLVGESEIPPPGERYLDTLRGRLELDLIRRRGHEELPLPAALDPLHRTRVWAAEQRLENVEAEAYIEISKVLRHQGQLSPARRPAFHGLRLARRANDVRLMILANFELSMISSGLDNDRYIKRMVDLGAKHAPGFHARVCYSQARSLWKTGNLLEAVELLRQCLELYNEVGDTYGYARAEVRFGSYLRLAGAHSQAETYLNNALTIAREERYRRVEGYALLRLAVLHRIEKSEHHVEPMMTEALTIFTEIGDTHGVAQAFGSLARLYREQCRFDEAIDYAGRCLVVCENVDETGFPPNRVSMATAIAYRRLWKCYQKADRLTAAQALFERALERYEGANDHFGQVFTMALMAEVLVAQGRHRDGELLASRVMTLLAETAGALFSETPQEDMDQNPQTLFYTITSLARWSEGLDDIDASFSADQKVAVKRTQSALDDGSRSVRKALQEAPFPVRGVTDVTELRRGMRS